ncbi:MAG: LTA synthase family protein [Bacteroidota bacterium]|nr:LTA synthase family protein [Bacteroidota bacterium]
MPSGTISFFRSYFRVLIAFVITVCLIRVFEYFTAASKYFISHAYQFELAGLLYDIWACFIYSSLFLLPYLLFYWINKRLAGFVFHFLNVLLIILYLALLVVFSERTRPYDHELFTRNWADSWLTTKQMLASGFRIYIPFTAYILLYFALYFLLFQKITIKKPLLIVLSGLTLLSVCFARFSLPNEDGFAQTGGYYLASNKFSYWIHDCYHYLNTRDQFNARKLNNAELEKEINFYQANHPFDFTNTEYPLMHKDNGKDVLGSFFALGKTPPNIVILVVEGLSRDFCGDSAYATSFTPFLDSLSKKSLVWDNFLSTAPGTFAAHPAISGSLPYGKRGFSLMSVMPDHLSLIKILRLNGYQTNFMIGFNPDFDNMGGYIRLQGTDFILSNYGPKYKQMGVGSEGWSMGYPDDALYSRSFEVMDSLKKTPYLNIYHTGTTHMPYLFEQKPLYEKLFDAKMKTISVSAGIKRTLKACKKVLVTYMFSDDCIKKFFADYAKRPEYANTIFFITGDHHIGSFPSTGNIDDYHVPLIVYSPMLKEAKKFYSVNSHNNLAPTISALLFNNYNLPYVPDQVHWLGDVMDTCATFRNRQSMPFMSWSREINDYIYKDYMLSEGDLYQLTPELLEVPCKNDSVKKHITRLLDNFKIINSYVCDNNKIYPPGQELLPGKKELLFTFNDSLVKTIYTMKTDTSLMPVFAVPKEYKYLFVEVAADVDLSAPGKEDQPSFRLALVDIKKNAKNYIYWSNRDIVLMTRNDYQPRQWNHVSTNDMFTLDSYRDDNNMVFELALFNQKVPIHLQMKQLRVNIYGIR